MMKLIQAGLVAVVVALVSVSAWAGPQEDVTKGWEAYSAENYTEPGVVIEIFVTLGQIIQKNDMIVSHASETPDMAMKYGLFMAVQHSKLLVRRYQRLHLTLLLPKNFQ
jgi:hypothetical protein